MLYVSGKSFGGMYLLADSETGEEVETTEEAILDKAKSGIKRIISKSIVLVHLMCCIII